MASDAQHKDVAFSKFVYNIPTASAPRLHFWQRPQSEACCTEMQRFPTSFTTFQQLPILAHTSGSDGEAKLAASSTPQLSRPIHGDSLVQTPVYVHFVTIIVQPVLLLCQHTDGRIGVFLTERADSVEQWSVFCAKNRVVFCAIPCHRELMCQVNALGGALQSECCFLQGKQSIRAHLKELLFARCWKGGWICTYRVIWTALVYVQVVLAASIMSKSGKGQIKLSLTWTGLNCLQVVFLPVFLSP